MDGQSPKIEELIENLNRQLSLYKDLLRVLREEKISLVSVQIKQIREATFLKEALLSDLQKLEIKRKRWIEQAAVVLAVPESELTIERISYLYGNAHHEQLISLRNALRFIVLQSQEANGENKNLTESALRESQVMKENALGMGGDRAQTYGPKGSVGVAKEINARILSREA